MGHSQRNKLVGYVNSGFLGHKTLKLHNVDTTPDEDSRVSKPLSYFSLFQYSTKCEKFCIIVGILLAIFSGLVFPILNILYGEFSNMMLDRQYPTGAPSSDTVLLQLFGGGQVLQNASLQERHDALENDSRAWGIGCATFTFFHFLSSTISVYLLNFTAARQVARIKILFFKATVCNDMSWFDTRMDGNFAGKASDQMRRIEEGIGGVIGLFMYLMSIFVIGILFSFLYGWKLTLAILSVVPISVGTSSLTTKFQSKLSVREMMSYTRAGCVAEEVFTSIRTVTAFEGEKKEVERYSKNLEQSKLCGIKRGVASGVRGGVLWLIIYSSYAIAFSFGVRLVQKSRENGDEEYTPGSLLIIFFGIVTGLTNIGFASGHLETFSVASGSAASVINVIKTKPKINPCGRDGNIGEVFKGEIEFRNVYFEYPSRPGIKILKGLNLTIKAGEIVGIVGGSGAGKSTILQLVQRLYDPSQGEILIDGQNIKNLKVSWLRQQLGVVGQEPLLFATTIGENIWYGWPAATEYDIMSAARKANAHDFIMTLKENYNTVVGQKGSTLSGGQKQRIAIARALVRNPKILLLDEATSALDATSEKAVQVALDRAAKGRTTLIVTHRLSTIANVDRIIVLENGVVAEEGTHGELVEAQGIYYQLLQSQPENVKEKKEPDMEVTTSQVVYEEPTLFLPGPRSRYSTLSPLKILPMGHVMTPPEKVLECKPASVWEILKWNKPEWCFLFVGSVASIIAGAALPVVCVFYGNLFGLMSMSDSHAMLRQTDIYSVILVVVGVIAGICVFLQMYCFAVAVMRLTTRLRIKAFESMIRQEIGWFDDERNKVGALCLRLSQDASGVQGAIGSRVGMIMQAFSTMTIGTILSFFFDWKMTLVTLATIPFVFGGVYIESVFSRGFDSSSNIMAESASKIAVEVISNIKVVASLSMESYFIEKYSQAIRQGQKYDSKKAWLRGFASGIGQTAPFFGYALSLWYGGMLVANENLQYKYVLMVSELLIFGAWTLGQSVVFAPSFGEAKASAGRLKNLFQRKAVVVDGNFMPHPDMNKEGLILYSNVKFAYPTRPGTVVLDDLNLSINGGKSVALVGPSGSGKSTVVQLLLRYYDPTSGTISLNGVSVSDYKISSLRKLMALVSQEPVLFDRTIEENIAYGDNSRVVPLEEVVEAAQSANIHSFISSLPLGYQTKLGSSGTQLSGGQKQRIAIARALVRNPQILLLDEATSALDTQSEISVQEALDKVSAGKTTITIAHRFGAIRNADYIFVLEKGRVKEAGTHKELINLGGIYFLMHGGQEGSSKEETSRK